MFSQSRARRNATPNVAATILAIHMSPMTVSVQNDKENDTSGRRVTITEEYVPKTKFQICIGYFKEFISFLFSHIGLCCLVSAYSLLGAVIFQAIEGCQNNKETCGDEWLHGVDPIVADFQLQVVQSIKEKGRVAAPGQVDPWDFVGSLLYSITIITTIGYGHITPKRELGQIVTMFYALLGIPLMFLCLANIGNFFANTFRFLYKNWAILWRRINRRRRRAPPLKAASTLRRSATTRSHAKSIKSHDSSYKSRHYDGANELMVPPTEDDRVSITTGYSTTTAYSAGTVGDPLNTGHNPGSGLHRNTSLRSMRMTHNDSFKSAAKSFNKINIGRSHLRRPMTRTKDEKVSVPITCSIMIIVVYIMGGAGAFSLWEENWTFLEGAYFCLITLSTIGFGDYVPGTKSETTGDQEKLIFCALYLLFGLAIICMAFDLMQEEVRNKFRWLARKIGIMDGDSV